MKAIIAEDEKLMRERLLGMLATAWPELAIVGVAKDGLEAMSLWKKHRPQIMFLDIRMPGKTGLEVAAEICTEVDAPQIVFVTAYDEYAIKAFANGAADYLLKPVEAERLSATVARLKKRLEAAPAMEFIDFTARLRRDGWPMRCQRLTSPRLIWVNSQTAPARIL